MKIAAVASALPEYRYHQEEITEAFRRYWGARLEHPALLTRLHSKVGVHYRHFALPIEQYDRFRSWGESNAAWFKVAQELGERAIDAALARSGVSRGEIDALFVVSVTGIASPSLDARLINRMGLRSDVKRTPIFGLGCVGGATGIVRASDYVLAWPRHTAVMLSVELCSLTLQRDDMSAPNLIATGLFGDGAAAAVIAGSATNFAGPLILATRSVFYHESENIMGWDVSERGFKVVLSADLPELIERRLGAGVDRFLSDSGLSRIDVGNWVIHTGGPKILEAVERALGLSDRELALSWESLARFGNLSSASVLLVLEDTMMNHRPAPGTIGLMLAMGPGFSAEMILLRW